MDEKITAWLKENVEKFRNPDGRVRIGFLESAIEASLGTSVGNQELYAWLEENGLVHISDKQKKETNVMGRPKGSVNKVKRGRPRGRYAKKEKLGGVSNSVNYVYVLRDLEERRDKIQSAISAVKEIMAA